MTPARKAALQWFHDRGEVEVRTHRERRSMPSKTMVGRMMSDGQLQRLTVSPWRDLYSPTDKGRRMLHGDRE